MRRPIRGLAATLALVPTSLTAALTVPLLAGPAAAAPVSVDCTTGPVEISDSTASYDLVGACSRVVVSGDNLKITFTSIDELDVSGSNDRLLGPTVGSAELHGANTTLRVTRVGVVRARGANNTVAARKGTGDVLFRGSNNKLSATRTPHLTIIGSNNRARLTHLKALLIRGPVNTVVVKKGRTSVQVHGANNVVRVAHRR